jgi:hypothetical protein
MKKPTPEWVAWVGLVALLVAAPIIGAAVGAWLVTP